MDIIASVEDLNERLTKLEQLFKEHIDDVSIEQIFAKRKQIVINNVNRTLPPGLIKDE